MGDAEARGRRAWTLLVQLFGREVLDRLARAGYDGAAAIAAVGAERLAAACDIPEDLARRICAVAEESMSAAAAPAAPEPPKPKGSRRDPGRKKVAPPLPVRKPPPRKSETTLDLRTPEEGDAFVDDVALVTWMGFSARTPSGDRAFSVADGILDYSRPAPPVPGPAADGQEVEGAAPAADSHGGAAEPPPAAKEAAPAIPPPRPVTLPGSFWSFGARRPDAAPRPEPGDAPAGRAPDNVTPAPPSPPRRNRHDH